MTRWISGLLLAAATLGVSVTGAAAETTLKALGFIAKNNPVMAEANAWTVLVNERMKGKVKINFIGGPFATAQFHRPALGA
jgi:TRAP-type C4-dicarboxylate transport system substrate-binding protein